MQVSRPGTRRHTTLIAIALYPSPDCPELEKTNCDFPKGSQPLLHVLWGRYLATFFHLRRNAARLATYRQPG
jgi:hypothetical protein